MENRIRIGISACLLGQPVRFDGSHKHDWSGSRFTTPKAWRGKKGVGVFARTFTRHFPLLPVEEEGRLNDAKLRENFIEQIFTLKRWRETLTRPANMKKLVDFHTRHKLLFWRTARHTPN